MDTRYDVRIENRLNELAEPSLKSSLEREGRIEQHLRWDPEGPSKAARQMGGIRESGGVRGLGQTVALRHAGQEGSPDAMVTHGFDGCSQLGRGIAGNETASPPG